MPTSRSASTARSRACRFAHPLVQPHRLHDLVADGVDGAERGHRLLEDEGDVLAADVPHLAAVGSELGQIHASRRPSSLRRRIEPDTMRPGRSTMRRIDRAVTLLPQPLSPTMPSVLPRIHVEVRAVHRLDRALFREEVRPQIAHFQNRALAHAYSSREAGGSCRRGCRRRGSFATLRFVNRSPAGCAHSRRAHSARAAGTPTPPARHQWMVDEGTRPPHVSSKKDTQATARTGRRHRAGRRP